MHTWTHYLADRSMGLKLADPSWEELDSFDCGSSDAELEVRDYFRSRSWFDVSARKASPATYQIGTVDHIVGYLAAGHSNQPHPSHTSQSKARYLTVYVAGIDTRFHGATNPHSPTRERYAEGLFRLAVEVLAPSKGDCVGVYLRVREANVRAISFYRRFGFVDDPGGPVGSYIHMRKSF